MLSRLLPTLILAAPAVAQTATPMPGSDWIIPSGVVVVYPSIGAGTIFVDSLHIEPGAKLIVRGPSPFVVFASDRIRIDGELNLSGTDSPGVGTLNTANLPEVGAPGHAGGGRGGVGSPLTTQGSLSGGDGQNFYFPLAGGAGAESATVSAGPAASRRAPGGGGGALGPNRPVALDPLDPANLGVVGTAGFNGAPTSLGMLSGQTPAQGGDVGLSPFVDGDASNDFWGRKLDSMTGATTVGELARPIPGSGGGAGGDSIPSNAGPFSPVRDDKGAGGAGGAGLGVLVSRRIEVGPVGSIHLDGGDGGGGENTNFLDRIGGGSGGGSGGYLIMEAPIVDLTSAGTDSITALGGRGGVGANNQHDTIGAGGNGGPGVLQIHVPPGPASLLLPAGQGIEDLTKPDAHILLPEFIF